MKILIKLILFSILVCACDSSDVTKHFNANSMKTVAGIGYVVPKAKIKPPRVVFLASMPKPQINLVANQEPPVKKAAGSLRFMQNYTSDHGLALDSVRCSFMDKDGNLWFGTLGGGASRFDGNSFTNFSEGQGLANDTVQSIYQDSSGSLWFGTIGGISRYDGKSFTNYTQAQGLAHDDVSSIFEDRAGIIWFATAGGVSKYNGKSFTTYSKNQGLANNSVNAITGDRKGNLWFATAGGASKFDGKTFTSYTKKDGLAHDMVRSILEDKAGNLWFGTLGGISKYDGSTFTTFSKTQGLLNDSVMAILQDQAGDLWFGTLGGVSRFNGRAFSNLTSAQGLANNDVQTIIADNTGNLWFGTKGGGVSKYQGESFTSYTSAQGMADALAYNITSDSSQNLWIGTEGGGAVKYDGQFFTHFSKAQGLPSQSVYGLFEDRKGSIWFGTKDSGASEYNGTSFTNYSEAQGLINDFVQAGIEDRAGNLWFGTNGGVSKFDGKSFTNYSEDQGLANDIVLSLIEDKAGNIWFGTNGGLSKFDGKSFTNFTKAQGLPSNLVSGVLEDKMGNIWLATSAGVLRYDGKTFLNYTVGEGLPDNTISWVAIGQGENLLIGTNRGLAVLSGYRKSAQGRITIPAQSNLSNEALKDNIPIFEIYNYKAGYPVKDVNQASVYIDHRGVAWFGTGSDKTGLVRFDYSALHKRTKTPEVFIQRVKINNENISWYDLSDSRNLIEEVIAFGSVLNNTERYLLKQKFGDIKFTGIASKYFTPENLELPHRHNNVTVDFAAIDPDKPQNILYQYKLEGYDKDWSPPANRTSAIFGNMFEGSYQFKVRAKGAYTDWSTPTTYAFKVNPPWYRTWWAYSLYAIFILTALYSLYEWRTAVLRERQKRLENLYESTERFLPKDFLRLLNKENVQEVMLGDSAEVEMSVMFSDIRAFTTMTEKLGHHKTALILNKYMSYMAPIVREFNGVVAQFLGDGIFAFFDIKPESAIAAIFKMHRTLPVFNKYLEEQDIDPVQIGVGLNVGPSMFSITGEERRLQGTFFSDDVNLAARLEGLNKVYKTNFLITGAVFDKISDPSQYLSLLVDRVIVVGKSKAVRIYALWPLPEGEELDSARHFIAIFHKAFASYQFGDFQKAEEFFISAHKSWKGGAVAELFIKRCAEFHEHGAPDNWDGTITLTEK